LITECDRQNGGVRRSGAVRRLVNRLRSGIPEKRREARKWVDPRRWYVRVVSSAHVVGRGPPWWRGGRGVQQASRSEGVSASSCYAPRTSSRIRRVGGHPR
jgi:hypothetical protein